MNPNGSQNGKVLNKDKNYKTIPTVQVHLLRVGEFTQSVMIHIVKYTQHPRF